MSKPTLTITHYLFLTEDQRYLLNVPEANLEVVGCCTPVWIQDGKHLSKVAEEVFAKYELRHCPDPEKQTINFTKEGFVIRLSPDMPEYLLNFSDGGKMHLNLTHKNVILVNNKIYPVVHFLSIEESSILEKTLVPID